MIEKNDLLRELQELTQQKTQYEQTLNKLDIQILQIKELYLKVLGKIDLTSKLLSQIDQQESESQQEIEKEEKEKVEE